jgi:hypothetical protein
MLSCVQGFQFLPKRQPTLIAHYSVNALMVNLSAVDLQPGPHPPVAIGGAVLDHASNGILQISVIGLGW